MEILANSASDVAGAYSKYYSKLASFFLEEIRSHKVRVLLEPGCGKGQLTIPLLQRLPKHVHLVAVDSSAGPYSGWLEELRSLLKRGGFQARVRIVDADATRMTRVATGSMDAVVSNELLCDLTPEPQLERAVREFSRVLRPGGVMVHGEWSSHLEDASQVFMAKHWPSWTPDQLHSVMRRSGFGDILVTYFDTTIKFHCEAALEELRSWGASDKLLKRHDTSLRRFGIQLPFEHVIKCVKPL